MALAYLANKTAIVAGGASGIGLAIAEALAAHGTRVLTLSRRSQAAVPAALPPGQVMHAHCDVTDEQAVEAVFARVATVDFVICSAGSGSFVPLVRTTAAEIREMLDVHIVGTFFCARSALRKMAPTGAGHIVAIGSVAALRTFTECSAYTAAKAGQLGLMRVLAEEAQACNVRVSTVMPGATDTPIWDTRPGFDRSKMMRAEQVAAQVLHVLAHPAVAISELVVMPPAGAL